VTAVLTVVVIALGSPRNDSPSNVTLEAIAQTTAGRPVGNLSLGIELANATGTGSWHSDVTNASGVSVLANLPSGVNVSSVLVKSPGYVLVSYSVRWPQNSTVVLTVVVAPLNSPRNDSGQNSTALRGSNDGIPGLPLMSILLLGVLSTFSAVGVGYLSYAVCRRRPETPPPRG